MATVKPFCALRPKKELAERIAALPYDVYSREEAKEEVRKEPLSFLSIDRAETGLDDSVDAYDPRVYEKAKAVLKKRIADGSFQKDTGERYYIYELSYNGRAQTGIAGCVSIDDYENNIIKKHENTKPEKEWDRMRHIDILNAQTGPVFLAYRENGQISDIVEKIKKEAPEYNFTAADQVTHRVWIINRPEDIDAIRVSFEKIDAIYIADGHHRAASAVKVGQERRKKKEDFTGKEEFNFMLSVLFPQDQLLIMDYNRVVKDLNGYTKTEFLDKISEKFFIEQKDGAYRPEAKGILGMYLSNVWYKLTAKPGAVKKHAVEGLDVALLQREILAPLLGIIDPGTDKRIDFIGGVRGLQELERRCEDDMKVAFSLYPPMMEELFQAADAGLLMPVKSTWFEPKLRSGLFIHEF